MNKVHFRFSTSILARLGEELNQASDQSILELVKNAYDADARHCHIEMRSMSEQGGTVRVRDDGDGMDARGIGDGWLVLGRSRKRPDQMTRLGRTPAGSKGLGRLAALRMGRSVRLESVARGDSRRIHKLAIDWRDFDEASTVEDVDLIIQTSKHELGGHGTVVELRELRRPIRTDEVKRLARSLLLLTDPFGDSEAGFSVSLDAPEFSQIESLVRQKYFEDADFHLVAEVDSTGSAAATLVDWRGQALATAEHADIRGSEEKFLCPPTKLDLWVFLLKSGDYLSGRQSKVSEVRQWLGHFGGVHVYQDGVRVAPYGNQGEDWLQMNLARVKSPEERPGTNTSIGRLLLTNSGPHRLTQKTDRSGFIEDEKFRELESFAKGALEWMARWRLDQAEQRRRTEKDEAPKAAAVEQQKLTQVIEQAPQGLRQNLQHAFSSYATSRDREADALRKEIQLYRTLSTAGITAATFAHESHGSPLKIIDVALSSLRTRVDRFTSGETRRRLEDPISQIQAAVRSLSVLGSATLSLIRAQKRRVGRTEIHKVIDQQISLLGPFFEGRDTKVEVTLADGNPFLRCSEAALESIITNLVNNSLSAFTRAATRNRIIRIQTQLADRQCLITVCDSGPGIVDFKVSEIWLPGITSDVDGTGLGLTIVRDTVKDLRGSVEVTANGPLGGAEFTIRLPILGH